MAGHLQVVTLKPMSGMDQTRTPSQSNTGTFFRLCGFKMDDAEPGKVKQCPLFAKTTTYSAGTYYNSGSQTEPSTSTITLITKLVTITDYVVRRNDTGAQAQVICQTTVPTGTGATKHCLLVINDITSAALSLGNGYTVVIDSATTFKWSKNGGSFTTAVPITTSGVSIDSGNATLFFLATTGFTVSDTWLWTRTDWTSNDFIGAGSTTAVPLQNARWRAKTFFVGSNGRIMQIVVDSTFNAIPYVITTGYRPIFGRSVNTFQDHLIVTNYVADTPIAGTVGTSLVVANSDLNDLDCFFSTDVNEVDFYTIPAELRGIDVATQLIGTFVFNAQLFILTNSIVYYTNYLGLPLVFSFQKYCNLDLGWDLSGANDIKCGVLTTAEGSERGIYIIGKKKVYFFNGSNFTDITPPVYGELSVNQLSNSFVSIHYFATNHEVWFRIDRNSIILVYQELTNSWHERYMDFNGHSCCFNYGINGVQVGSGNLNLYQEAGLLDTVVFDAGGGTSFGIPTIIHQMLSDGEFSRTKETDSTYILCSTPASGVSFNLKWILSNYGEMQAAATAMGASLTSTSTTNLVTYPRLSFRGIMFQLELVNAAPTASNSTLVYYGLESIINGWTIDETDR